MGGFTIFPVIIIKNNQMLGPACYIQNFGGKQSFNTQNIS